MSASGILAPARFATASNVRRSGCDCALLPRALAPLKPASSSQRAPRRGHVLRAATSTAVLVEKRSFIPIIGETPEILADPIAYCQKRTAEYGPVFSGHFALSESVMVTDAKLIQEVLSSEHKTVVMDIIPPLSRLTESKLFGGLRNKTDTKATHKMDRKFLMEFFTQESIASYYPYIQDSAQTRINGWCKEPQVGFVKEIKDFAFDVMNTQLAGVKFSADELEELDELWKDFNNGGVDFLMLNLPFTDFGKGVKAERKIVKIIMDALTQTYGPDFTERKYDVYNIATGLLSQKAEDGVSWRLTVEEVAEILRSILFAGHETTSNALCVAMNFLARNPEVMEAIRVEQMELLEKYGDRLTPEILEGTYTEATAVEVMRLQNIDKVTRNGMFLFRRALHDFELGGKLIQKDSKVLLAVGYCTYKIEEFLPTVEQFQPERWLIPGKSAVATMRAKGAMPFGGGPRVCAGEALAWAEMKVFLSVLARTADFRILNPDCEWRRSQGSIAKNPIDGLQTAFSAAAKKATAMPAAAS